MFDTINVKGCLKNSLLHLDKALQNFQLNYAKLL